MTIPRDLSNLAPGANTSGVLQPSKGGTGLTSPGSNGNILTSNGTAWVSSAPASSGAMTFISQVVASNSATVGFTGLSSSYNTYLLTISGLKPVSDRPSVYIKLSTDNNSTFVSNLESQLQNVRAGSAQYAYLNANSYGYLTFSSFASSPDGHEGSGFMYIYNPSSTSATKTVYSVISGFDKNSGTESMSFCATTYPTTGTAINGFRIECSSGNISSGVFRLYGIS